MRRRFVACLLLSAMALAACGGSGVRVGTTAVDEAARAMGAASGRVVELTSDDVSRLAGAGGVSEDSIRTVAVAVDAQPQWRQWLGSARTVYARTDGDVRTVALGTACDGVNGRIGSADELYWSLAQQLSGLSEPQLKSVYEATVDLWNDLYEARSGDDPDRKSAALITCYVLQQLA
jgi:hypothetical protein